MAHKLPSYYFPLQTKREPMKDEAKWSKAEDFFDNGEYRKAVISTLEYSNSKIFKGVNVKQDISIDRVHGSVGIKIELNDSKFRVYCDIASIDNDTQIIPLLRRVAEVNFSMLDYSHIVYDGDKLYIDCKLQLHRCKPNMVHWILQEVVFNADEFSNEFIYKYGAKDINAVAKKALSKSQKKQTIEVLRKYLSEFDEFVDYFEKNNKSNFAWDMIIITLYKIANMTYINGYLKYELMQKIAMIHDRDIDFYDRINRGKSFIKEIQGKSDNYFEELLYFREDLISMLKYSNVDILKSWFEDYSENLVKFENDNDSFTMCYYMEAMFLRVIYNYNLSPRQKSAVEETLHDISRGEIDASKDKMVKLYNKFMDKDISDSKSNNNFLKSMAYWVIWIMAINVIFRMFK